ncbi:phage recombination protein Bet [Vibrio fluvialis]|uniref:phage recombination protein Bet n=1 Tax=Vibrio fluvialis TaxID=676 RepID=UPI001EEA0202|nr:phage recombination protein Bet [Vibrio fluvialis]MCG6366972.1 phage recombination protein Bet [Vibrio fluvialis]MCG6375667.1 phage recombination protein Bet [Vibrio fluvialis]
MATALSEMAGRLKVQEQELHNIIMATVMPTGRNAPQVTKEQFISFLAVANEYRLNPLTKEVYAFPTKGGGIQPIVSIDGWLKIINNHSDFDGMEFEDSTDQQGQLISITCKIYRKDRKHPTSMTEYMSECKGASEPWTKWPSRMLRHKATIQAARYAFGLSGIIDPDEAERYQESGVIEKDVTPEKEHALYSQSDFDKNFPSWKSVIESGRKTPEQVISMVEAKGLLTEEMKLKIKQIAGE